MAVVELKGATESLSSERRGLVDKDFWRGRRVLVTGHTGFKGSWLTLWLTQIGAQVTGISDRVPTDPALYSLARVEQDIDDVRLDVRDHQALASALVRARPEIVIHMAAQSLVRASFQNPRETYETNVMGTVNLLDAVRSSDSTRAVVNVTSDKCYENREWDWGYRESEPMGGHDPYSNSKGCAELVTDAYRRSFFSETQSVRLASARAGNVVGGGDWARDRLVPDIMRGALDGAEIRIRNPHSIRPWQHVLNPLSGYLVLAQALFESAEYASGWNFGPADEDAREVQWIVAQITELWPVSLRWVTDSDPHPHEAAYLKLDSSRARAHLSWRPTWGLADGIAAVVSWYRGLRDGEDMRSLTLRQIESFQYAGALS